jgi:hypothetical protein
VRILRSYNLSTSNHGCVDSPVALTSDVLINSLATTTGIISEVVASQPPGGLVEEHARNSIVVSDKDLALQSTATHVENYRVSHNANDVVEWDVTKFPPPTEEEQVTLRKVAGGIPWIGYSLCVVEFAERASYYGATQVFANFLQWPLPEGKLLLSDQVSCVLM